MLIKKYILKDFFPVLEGDGELTCYLNDAHKEFADGRREPAMLICPGGAYCCVCYHREGEMIALPYMTRGYHAFVLRYSVAPAYHYPTQLMEAAAALALIRQHADEWCVDPDRIGISGFSAGGHLAASLGVFWQEPFLAEALGVESSLLRPSAMVLGYAVLLSKSGVSHEGSIQNLCNTTDRNDPLWKKMSLEDQITDQTPPAYLWHTAEDSAVPVENSLAFASGLARHKIPFELHVFPFGPHGLATCNRATNGNEFSVSSHYEEWINESMRWLNDLWGYAEK